jgi:hydroxyethylthiazole kinase-like uncharacterized protein yjeF
MKSLDELLADNPLPQPEGGKDDKGTVVIIGGPPTCPGGALLAGTSALRAAAGRVQLCVDPSVAIPVAVALPEVAVVGWDMRAEVPQDLRENLAGADVVVVGVGFKDVPIAAVRAVAAHTDALLILDAGALHAAPELAATRALVVAPNTAEAARLLDSDDDAEERLAPALAQRLGQPVAVRGVRAVVATDDDAWSYDALPSGLGTPGSGDVFVGALAALLGNGCKPAPALGWAITLHANAARRRADRTPVGYLARDISEEWPAALADALG